MDLQLSSAGMNAYDIMSVNIVAATTAAFNGIPIIDDYGKPIGIVTTIDLLKAVKEHKTLDNIDARQIMTSNPAVINQDATRSTVTIDKNPERA